MGNSKRRKQIIPSHEKYRAKASINIIDLIQPKKGIGKLVIGDHAFSSEWAALGVTNIESSVDSQKGFLLIKTSDNTYAFLGEKPFEKIVNNSPVISLMIVDTDWQWKLSIVKIILVSENNKVFDFKGEVLADRKRGFNNKHISVKGSISSGKFINHVVNFKFKELQELPPIMDQRFIFD